MNFIFECPTKLIFGSGKLDELSKEKMPGKKALIVISCGKSIKANGYLERLETQLKQIGIDYALYDKVDQNPSKDTVMEGANLAKVENCDFVIALGGGSVIDASKAMANRLP